MQQMYNTDIHTYIYFPQFHEQQDCGNWQHAHIEIHIENGSARNMRLYMWTCKNSNIKLTNMFTYDLRKTFVFILCRIICFSSYHICFTKI